jgi:Sulfotransferase family
VFFHLFRDRYAERAFDRAIDSPGPRWLKVEEVSQEEFLSYLGVGMNALMASRSEGLRWIDHTPLNTLIAATLGAVFPGASFVHILRDGREVVNSMLNFLDSRLDPAVARFVKRESGWSRDIREACATWSQHVDAARAFCDEHPDRATVVRYEELVAAPPETFGRIQRFLGIADEERPARSFSAGRINSSFGDRPRLSASQLWETWDDEWRGAFTEVAGATMVRCGYWTSGEFGTAAGGGAMASGAPTLGNDRA